MEAFGLLDDDFVGGEVTLDVEVLVGFGVTCKVFGFNGNGRTLVLYEHLREWDVRCSGTDGWCCLPWCVTRCADTKRCFVVFSNLGGTVFFVWCIMDVIVMVFVSVFFSISGV